MRSPVRPRLWLLLPDSTRKELQEARAALNTAVRNCLWSLLFLVWTPLAWWIPLLALPVAWISYRMSLNTAAVYVDLLEATFDVHRHSPLPSLACSTSQRIRFEKPKMAKKINAILVARDLIH